MAACHSATHSKPLTQYCYCAAPETGKITAGGGVVVIGILGHADQVAMCTQVDRICRRHCGANRQELTISCGYRAESGGHHRGMVCGLGVAKWVLAAWHSKLGRGGSPVAGAMGCGARRPGRLQPAPDPCAGRGATGGFRSVAPQSAAAGSPSAPRRGGSRRGTSRVRRGSALAVRWNPAGRPARRLRHPRQPAA